MQDKKSDNLLSSTRPAPTPDTTEVSERLAALRGVSPTADVSERLAALLAVAPTTGLPIGARNTPNNLPSSTRPAATPRGPPTPDASEQLAALLGVTPAADFLTGPRLAALLGVSSMTLYRWTLDERLNFPQPSRVHGRKFWHRPDVIAWMKARAVQRTPRPRSLAMPNALEEAPEGKPRR
jgi:predicted DNA-binding transcriptional regulator AlpA